uniref:ATP synthase F0 subunit 8 n=1 Tax=Pulchriphyllium bioculatum TaxID=58609 RepID=UPI0025A9725E|nr:ATP synthase F0 subunit 8 [Pulchriphyllium bioculatum]WID87097.1 ATP synthase F0 subunit 8 [Pulchriphyllium bioculatum]
MPQTAPMKWLMMFIYTISIMMLFLTNLYFNKNYKMNNFKKKSNKLIYWKL